MESFLITSTTCPSGILIWTSVLTTPRRAAGLCYGAAGCGSRPATAEDVAEMRRLTEQAMRAGAMGFTGSRH